ncbi:MAG: pyridoxal-phosphate dependent enzyme [Chloroflexi bacterium]|nr:pyridoxal-phosphate dependent enzyme [Chloroflexota bacterium]
MISLQDIRAAATLTAPHTIRTPQRTSPALSQRLGCEVSLKLEMRQHSGSFKTRGAFHQMLALGEAALSRGVVAVSGGNFARAVAYCSGVLGVDAFICMPKNAPTGSIAATRGYGAEVELLPDAVAAFARADELAAAGRCALHPFDSHQQMAGNGIVALEIMHDCPGLTDIIVSIGGGGLIAGVIAAVKAQKPAVRVWGVEPIKAPTMQRALAAGKIVNIVPGSLSATLGGPFVGQVALDLCQAHLEDLVLVSDMEMIAAQQWFIQHADLRPELAATSTLAAALRIQDRLPADAHLALLICGGNDSDEDIERYAGLLAAAS